MQRPIPTLIPKPAAALLGLALSLFALSLAVPTAASPEGQIVIRGAASGSHLRLTVKRDRIFVDGRMARHRPVGCHFTNGRNGAVCPLDGVGGIEIAMGPQGDMVEILDRLPIPLTARLGGGSDKMIANGEPDTCYPEGSRRNRCVGGPGRDICFTGQRNSDCVGGAGRDYCRHGRGSDGCWGGRGDDVCVMGPGHDGCHGGPGNDRLYGGSASDQLYGGPGRDFCDGGRGWGKSHGCETGPRR
jgi:RTX calcium-binding nonapeptide repeat (4 copies)